MQDQRYDNFEQRLKALEAKARMPDHRHNGFDVSRILWDDLSGKKVFVHYTVPGTGAATAANYGVFWIAPFTCYLLGFKEVHQTAGSDAGSVTLTLEKLGSGVAPDSGTAMLSSALSLKATANTVQTATISATTSALNLAIGDRLCLKDSGVLTNVANVTVGVELMIN